jgi:hypothetical protein
MAGWAVTPEARPEHYFIPSYHPKVKQKPRRRKTHRDPQRTRDYEYVVYPSTRVEGHGIKVLGTGFKNAHLAAAKKVAKLHPGSGIYSVSKGGFVGWINYNGRYVSFR